MACQLELELTEDDVPGSKLEEPLESAMVPALRRWLLCHGIQVPTSLKKLIERLGVNICLLLMLLNRHRFWCTVEINSSDEQHLKLKQTNIPRFRVKWQ